jgi:SM-20-related protein
MNPILLDNFFPADLYDRLRKTVRSAPMSYGSKSNSRTDPHGHWSWKPIHDSTHNLADLSNELFNHGHKPLSHGWNFLFTGPCIDMKLVRCYANGYTYGTDGYFHRDSEREGELTVIIYICDEWPLDWAGETVCTDGKTYWSYMPRPNRVLILPSNMMHAARAVSRKCTGLRTTLMYKARPRRSHAFEYQSDWLRDTGALKFDHSDGSLHDHLMRVFYLLEQKLLHLDNIVKMGNTADVAHSGTATAMAGGLHSIYGTNAFTKQLLEPHASSRSWVADKFGKEAEDLAYLFHLLDRPKTLEEAKFGDGDVCLQYRHQETDWFPQHRVRALQLIECANLADQGSLEKWPNLLKLWCGWSKPE